MRKIYLVFALALYGCTANQGTTSRPGCPAEELGASADYIYSLLACGDQKKALVITKNGADSGSSEMSNLYIQILASNNDSAAGLVYALRYAEAGDFESAQWVMRIARKNNIRILDEAIARWYISYISSGDNRHAYLAITELLQYALGSPVPKTLIKDLHLTEDISSRLSSEEMAAVKSQIEKIEK
ncbi:hypothetical protein [Pseudomonas sp.]|uniref:hypothetical protein n=1 Tax=Pseudomonas sp. TaxID=306 RepID=UPI003C793D83